MDNLEEKIKKIVMTGVGVVVNTAEKTKDAIVGFVKSDQAKELADKGEKAVQSALDAGNKAFTKVKEMFTEAELKERVAREKERLTSLAKQVGELTEQQLEVFNELLQQYRDSHSDSGGDAVEADSEPPVVDPHEKDASEEE